MPGHRAKRCGAVTIAGALFGTNLGARLETFIALSAGFRPALPAGIAGPKFRVAFFISTIHPRVALKVITGRDAAIDPPNREKPIDVFLGSSQIQTPIDFLTSTIRPSLRAPLEIKASAVGAGPE